MNYVDSVIKEKEESQSEWMARISKKKQKLEKKFHNCKIIAITLMETAHLYTQEKPPKRAKLNVQ